MSYILRHGQTVEGDIVLDRSRVVTRSTPIVVDELTNVIIASGDSGLIVIVPSADAENLKTYTKTADPTTLDFDYPVPCIWLNENTGNSWMLTDVVDNVATWAPIANTGTPQGVVSVAKSGGDYTTIQGAIAGITDASATNVYTILIYSGIYTENIDLTSKPYIHLKGSASRAGITITSTSGITLTLNNTTTRITTLKLESTGGSVLKVPSGATGKNFKFRNCSFRESISNTFADAIEIQSGNVEFLDCKLHYIHTGTGGGTHRMINVTGSANLESEASSLKMTVAATADDVVALEESDNVINSTFLSSIAEICRNGVVTGETTFYLASGTSHLKDIIGNFIQWVGGNCSGL